MCTTIFEAGPASITYRAFICEKYLRFKLLRGGWWNHRHMIRVLVGAKGENPAAATIIFTIVADHFFVFIGTIKIDLLLLLF